MYGELLFSIFDNLSSISIILLLNSFLLTNCKLIVFNKTSNFLSSKFSLDKYFLLSIDIVLPFFIPMTNWFIYCKKLIVKF